jgi:hypothetical protein
VTIQYLDSDFDFDYSHLTLTAKDAFLRGAPQNSQFSMLPEILNFLSVNAYISNVLANNFIFSCKSDLFIVFANNAINVMNYQISAIS